MSIYSHNVPVNNAIRKYENHPSVKSETIAITSTVHFSGVDKADEENSTGDLNSSQVGTSENIPRKCLKVTSDECSPFVVTIWNQNHILNKKFMRKL